MVAEWVKWRAVIWSSVAVCIIGNVLIAFLVLAGGRDIPGDTLGPTGWAFLLLLALCSVAVPGGVMGAQASKGYRFVNGLVASLLGWSVAFIPMMVMSAFLAPKTSDVAGQGEALAILTFGVVFLGMVTSPIVGGVSVLVGEMNDQSATASPPSTRA